MLEQTNTAAAQPSGAPANEQEIPQVPPNFDQIVAAIEESREMLTWEDDWDGEGSVGYAESTWQRAVDFLKHNAIRLWKDFGACVEAPRVLPGPDGSIDIHWQTGDHELLVNIPRDSRKPTTYYGDTSAGLVVKGNLDTSCCASIGSSFRLKPDEEHG